MPQMLQFTNYQIRNKEDKKVLFNNTNTACFAQLFGSYSGSGYNHKDSGYNKQNLNREMRIFFAVASMNASEELIKFWTNTLCKLGLPIKYEVIDFKDSEESLPHGVKKTPHYVWTLDFNKYDSLGRIKLCCHLVRYLFEMNCYNQLQLIMDYKKKYPRIGTFKIIQFMFMFSPEGGLGGHIIAYPGKFHKINPLSKLYELYNKWANSDRLTSGAEINDFQRLLVFGVNPYENRYQITRIPEIHKDMTIKEYENYLKLNIIK